MVQSTCMRYADVVWCIGNYRIAFVKSKNLIASFFLVLLLAINIVIDLKPFVQFNTQTIHTCSIVEIVYATLINDNVLIGCNCCWLLFSKAASFHRKVIKAPEIWQIRSNYPS